MGALSSLTLLMNWSMVQGRYIVPGALGIQYLSVDPDSEVLELVSNLKKRSIKHHETWYTK